MTTNTTKIAGEDMTDEQIRKSMTGEQIRLERKLTCEAIDGAMAFGYQNTNPPPSDDHWLAPYWKIGRQQAEMDAGLLASKAAVAEGWKLVPVRMTASMINAWSGGSTVSTDEVAYRTPFQEAWKRMLAASPTAPAQSCGDAEQADGALTLSVEQRKRIAQIVHTDCTLIPGATFYNAAEMAIDATLAQIAARAQDSK